ncbi:DDE-type integrase/transposase/recombinase [Leptospira kirschneri]|uniref:Integrase core domain protein n=1 Tax=Leptospira kirschneri serovar Bulgarica str. Nikolaevo TaxID=1240687 RepID=M6F7W4_9LEPT|nr:DDE-type integrase/transposase/recombinase [Leptospira kirschneri]EMK22406.1 integrase core domain protein [Leptospira kirschneri serovar Bulgarica str. Nikolaevo]EMK24490.1 integrase core domain protein [Leptospira kirschneri serovar Bulgarica str. Nikolaevo]EMK24846.1 integrase core domain protein [Leptospira kirschneri serovar Bulgarica str. Nikolaevo]
MKQLDPDLFYEFYSAWRDAPSKHAKGEMMRKASSTFGLSEDAIRRRFEKYKTGSDLSIVSGEKKGKRKSNLNPERMDLRENEAKIIAEIVYSNLSGKNPIPLSMEIAIRKARNSGQIHLPWTISTANRWLNRLGLGRHEMRTAEASRTWKEPYSNSTHMVDASVANRYYLNPRGKIERRAFLDDKDEETAMFKDGLIKVWIYVLVDVYSKAFFMRAYGGKPLTPGAKHRGENSVDYLDFFKRAWLPKDDRRIPFEGIPEFLYCDEGSGLKAVRTALSRLGIVMRTHTPGRPQAKGPVERRIGLFKNIVEPAIDGKRFADLDEFNELLRLYTIHENQIRGTFDLWHSGTKIKPVQRITEQNFYEATVAFDSRVVNNYGCIEYRNHSYGVALDLVGQKITLFKDREGNLVAEDRLGNLYICNPDGARSVSQGTGFETQSADNWKKSDRMRLRESIREGAKKQRKISTIEDLYPESELENLRYFPANAIPVETSATIAPAEFLDTETAWSYIERRLLAYRSEMPEQLVGAIQQRLESSISLRGSISNQEVYDLLNILNNIDFEIKDKKESAE